MYNVLLDKYPTTYKGYLLRTDYRIGIQITAVLEDSDLEDEERIIKALELLYGAGIPDDIYVALNGLKWFMSCGKSCNEGETTFSEIEDIDDEVEELNSSNNKIAYDFEIDSELVYSAMYFRYGVELDKEKMHWFKFISLFKGLKDTELNDLMYYRTVDVSKLPKGQQPEMRKLQEKYRIRKLTSQRKKELVAVFGTDWEKHI